MGATFSRCGGRRVVMLGLDAAGKTSVLYRLRLGEVVQTIPTKGFNVETIALGNGLSFDVWDIGGQDRIRPLWRHYSQNTQGIIFVVDSSDHGRVDEARDELHEVVSEEQLQRVAILVFANKQDLDTAMPCDQLVEKLELNKIKDRLWHIQPCSATTGRGVDDGMKWLGKAFRETYMAH
eukprot:TRINITY_DN4829_c0_g1_i1.p1 TRINITY_DN4829_c0_g1~~TRINITY_DN4829_c0_g1_i1.p1  ORF type:complete len:199 (+),score=34.53 TRINITY_DN4829_c0_g1_i1:61-597(+)